jgi:hypothetical protein
MHRAVILVQVGDLRMHGSATPHISISAADHAAGKHAGAYVSVHAAAGLADVLELTGGADWLIAALRRAVGIVERERSEIKAEMERRAEAVISRG